MAGTSLQTQQPFSQPKPLKFVTSYGAPHPKRRRIGAACLTCRKRKTACSGEKPSCDTCKQNKLECAGYTLGHVMRFSPECSQDDRRSGQQCQSQPKKAVHLDQSSRHEHGVDLKMREETEYAQRKPHVEPQPPGPETSDQQCVPSSQPLFAGPRNRMPYFRWLGPTAIMPGFKQMVVKVKRADTDLARSSTDGMRSPSAGMFHNNAHTAQGFPLGTSSTNESEARTPLSLPSYDASPVPPSELITHLADTFFTHLGCNYPFLQRDRFLRDLNAKQVDAILVDAVCALAARFSTDPLLKQQLPHEGSGPPPAEYGHGFAIRAKAALMDTFACPSVAAVQAALLLAYNEFGESRDSGLWMYLGISIRMAQDLGMHKLQGLRYQGRDGPTPKGLKRQGSDVSHTIATTSEHGTDSSMAHSDSLSILEQKAIERERIDTFWAVFFLDRVVSSGTGRRSTLRDKEIELSFPPLNDVNSETGWPAPFPALIRIIHLYGRVADLLNCINEPTDVTSDTSRRLAAMESQVTQFYQGLSPQLHFDAINFQHYMKAGEGTNFVLLHFWFHTLIVLLHRPTLLKTFEGNMLQLFPNSQQLSMSSAKTIADILAYSQLMDGKASLGNPFTSQPIYIAACAFLRETVEQTATSNARSPSSSPSLRQQPMHDRSTPADCAGSHRSSHVGKSKKAQISVSEQKAIAKHTLLATAANQHYQLCYKALESLETFWAGAKYILTVLDQKFEGVGDPLLYTVEEGESALESPRPEPMFTSPGWRRKLSWGSCTAQPHPAFFAQHGTHNSSGSPGIDPSKAIGWTMTGTTDSASANVAWHYPLGTSAAMHAAPAVTLASVQTSPITLEAAHAPQAEQSGQHDGRHRDRLHPNSSNLRATPSSGTLHGTSAHSTTASPNAIPTADANLLLSLNPPYHNSATGIVTAYPPGGISGGANHVTQAFGASLGYPTNSISAMTADEGMHNFGNMEIAPVNVDMSMLGLEMMPWFDAYTAPALFDTAMPNHDSQNPMARGSLPYETGNSNSASSHFDSRG